MGWRGARRSYGSPGAGGGSIGSGVCMGRSMGEFLD
jgi:hypothetical protein